MMIHHIERSVAESGRPHREGQRSQAEQVRGFQTREAISQVQADAGKYLVRHFAERGIDKPVEDGAGVCRSK